ncbi:hypothetical protein AT1G42700 [Arabidopsis thaliana]|uniref:Uncharacterized protein F8D11.10 n=1 Tax=Arabidopsis thaliana TaxID=3702 RepID=Q9C843_ARATH|nr:uncharacterized protein AT1G42700 [Arabidopsis thaliana]AAG51226.1 hypothetical protein; 88907-89568 [Arabidopsis thaliana]AEE31930.1 hypothetical protein AT1G42700 [Arabidopsis thaliana]|eukprot:NP_174992.1 hypothetical protein AT1G42700 [Arabidopsis thaliana]
MYTYDSDKTQDGEENLKCSLEKLAKKIIQNAGDTNGNNSTPNSNDDFAQVFGRERPGRVRCVGLGPTPSSFIQNRTTTTLSKEQEVLSLNNRVRELEDKLVKMSDLEDKVDKMNEVIYISTCRRQQQLHYMTSTMDRRRWLQVEGNDFK